MKVNALIDFVSSGNFYSLYRCEKAIDEDSMKVLFVARKLESNSNFGNAVLTDIYKCEDGFAGITGIVPDDGYTADEKCKAEQFIAVPSVDYIPKSLYENNASVSV